MHLHCKYVRTNYSKPFYHTVKLSIKGAGKPRIHPSGIIQASFLLNPIFDWLVDNLGRVERQSFYAHFLINSNSWLVYYDTKGFHHLQFIDQADATLFALTFQGKPVTFSIARKYEFVN